MRVITLSGAKGSGKSEISSILSGRCTVVMEFADPLKRFSRDVFLFSDKQLWGASKHREHQIKGFEKGSLELKYHLMDGRFSNEHWNNSFIRMKKILPNFISELELGTYFLNPEAVMLEWFVNTYNTGITCPRDVLISLGALFKRNPIMANCGVNVINKVSKGFIYTQKEGLHDCGSNSISTVVVPGLRFEKEMNALKSIKASDVGLTMVYVLRDQMEPVSPSLENLIPITMFDVIIQNNGSLQDLRNNVKNLLKD